jgi:hypothetical protein
VLTFALCRACAAGVLLASAAGRWHMAESALSERAPHARGRRGTWKQLGALHDYQRHRGALRHHTRRVARCLETAVDAREGHECLAAYLAVLPHEMVAKALRRGLEDASDQTSFTKDAPELADSLRGCIDVAGAWAGAVFCLEDLIANIPRAIVQAAVRSAEAHPAFDYAAFSAQGSREAATFSSCVHHASDVKAGTDCLAALFGALPRALSLRAVEVCKRLPAPTGPAARMPPQGRAQQLAKCMYVAKASDAALYCLSDYLRTLPSAQVSQVCLCIPRPASRVSGFAGPGLGRRAAVLCPCAQLARGP